MTSSVYSVPDMPPLGRMTGTTTGTGVTRHQEQVIARVESLLGAALSLMPLGFDFTLLCNARPIADRIAVEFVYQPQFNDAPWTLLNLRPGFPSTRPVGCGPRRSGS
jgi:hypothetical protein